MSNTELSNRDKNFWINHRNALIGSGTLGTLGVIVMEANNLRPEDPLFKIALAALMVTGYFGGMIAGENLSEEEDIQVDVAAAE